MVCGEGKPPHTQLALDPINKRKYKTKNTKENTKPKTQNKIQNQKHKTKYKILIEYVNNFSDR
jgi:hypothetical protein